MVVGYVQSGEKDIDWKRELEFPFPKIPPSWENPLSCLFHELTMKVRSILVVRILATIITKFLWTGLNHAFSTAVTTIKVTGFIIVFVVANSICMIFGKDTFWSLIKANAVNAIIVHSVSPTTVSTIKLVCSISKVFQNFGTVLVVVHIIAKSIIYPSAYPSQRLHLCSSEMRWPYVCSNSLWKWEV